MGRFTLFDSGFLSYCTALVGIKLSIIVVRPPSLAGGRWCVQNVSVPFKVGKIKGKEFCSSLD